MHENAQVLDLGCGTGLELDFYFQHNPTAKVTGIDFAESMIKVLKEKFPDKDITVISGSYFDIPFGEECYDAVVSVESLHHFTRERKSSLYKKVFQALKKGGYLILTDYFAESEEHERLYQRELQRLKSEQGICDDEFYHYDTPLTKPHEMQILNEAGFSSVEIIAEWNATAAIKAIK